MIGRTQLPEVEVNAQNQTAQTVLADESAIRRVVDEIDNAVDAKDWTRARFFFTEQVNTDFTSLAGGKPARITADELVGGWRTNLYEEKKSFHLRGNHRITVNGNRAEVFSKAYAINAIEKGAVAGIWEIWGVYENTLVKTDAGWKVSGMTLKVVRTRGDDKIRTYLPAGK